MKKKLLTGLVTGLLIFGMIEMAHATPILDQQYDPRDDIVNVGAGINNWGGPVAQTFTAGQTGEL